MNPLRLLLAPLAALYGVGVWLRNLLYDSKLLKSHEFPAISTITIGNLTTGGTGKTPHTEYLIRLLKDEFNIATLSRGYGRKSRGYQLATLGSSHEEIGDEPRQFKQKFPEVPIAVEAERALGIQTLMESVANLDVVLLDDAFQHRPIHPGIAILLTEYSNLFIDDFILPVGNLREPKSGMRRADIIIVTKSPEVFSPLDRRAIKDRLSPKSYQQVYFSYFKYGAIEPVFPGELTTPLLSNIDHIILVTGIAHSGRLLEYLNHYDFIIEHLEFGDHHDYSDDDLTKIEQTFKTASGVQKIILTTEKDAMRLQHPDAEPLLKLLPIYYIPIEVAFHGNDSNEFNEQIIHYVRRNKVNSQFHS